MKKFHSEEGRCERKDRGQIKIMLMKKESLLCQTLLFSLNFVQT
jgi:hypothetical protein